MSKKQRVLVLREALRRNDAAAAVLDLLPPLDRLDDDDERQRRTFTVLYEACRLGKAAILRDFLASDQVQRSLGGSSLVNPIVCVEDDSDDDDTAPCRYATTLLHAAAPHEDGNYCLQVLLLDQVNARNPWQANETGDLPIWSACRYGRLESVRLLADAMRRPSHSNGTTPHGSHDADAWRSKALETASRYGHVSIVEYLLVQGASDMNVARLVEHCAFAAALWGHVAVLECLWQGGYMRHDVLTTMVDALGGTVGHRACASLHATHSMAVWTWIASRIESTDVLAAMVVQCDVHGETALLTASWDDRVPLLRWLWEHSASASREARQAALCRAIFYACDNGQVQALAVLLSWYAGSMELEQCVVDGRTCLEKVILYGHEECFSLLVGPKYRFRVTVAHLRLAVRLGRVGMMHTFLPAHPLLLKTTCWGDKRGVRSILHVSIAQCQPGKQEHLEYLWCLINLLVDHKHMDVLQSKDDEGKDPLALSIQVKNFPLAAVLDDPLLTCRTVQDIKNLLASGNCTSPALAAARSKPPKGWTPLHTSCALGRLEVVQHLLQQTNVNVTAATANGMTALHWAARHGHTGIVGELLAAHNRQTRKPTATAACKMTPLHHAARYGHVEIVQALLTTGRYDVNAVDEELQTPLFTATAAGQARVVSVLAVAAGIALDGLTSAHETCLQRACLDQRDDLVAMLVEAGAQGGVTHPETGETALHYAASCGFGSTPGVVILQQLFDRGDSTAPDQTLLSVLLQCAVAAHEDELLWQPAPASEFPVIDFLVRRGAALTQLDDTGQTILERAQHPTLRLFLEARRDVDSECGTHTMYL